MRTSIELPPPNPAPASFFSFVDAMDSKSKVEKCVGYSCDLELEGPPHSARILGWSSSLSLPMNSSSSSSSSSHNASSTLSGSLICTPLGTFYGLLAIVVSSSPKVRLFPKSHPSLSSSCRSPTKEGMQYKVESPAQSGQQELNLKSPYVNGCRDRVGSVELATTSSNFAYS
ncbi:hypothetical protein PIB30_007006 [Stylosanthes scabra]|uniref:Uncharacterized protein n=1 Tax=Stylosanthes scabra TaxID=79078 RepID=A0ABU6Z547_9FABA|nr:hypothetical protein [Stylosanthes scabra]